MKLIRHSAIHWQWGQQHIRYNQSFGNSGWYWDKDNDGIAWGVTRDTFLEVLNEISRWRRCSLSSTRKIAREALEGGDDE